MRFIPTKAHAIMDYLGGLVLMIAPLFWLNDPGVPAAAVWTPVVVGALMLGQSLITDYELSLANVLPVSAHLGMDFLAGVALALSPWMFDFADIVWAPHLILGLLEIGAAVMSKTHRSDVQPLGSGATLVGLTAAWTARND
jgi:hypothetical protein